MKSQGLILFVAAALGGASQSLMGGDALHGFTAEEAIALRGGAVSFCKSDTQPSGGQCDGRSEGANSICGGGVSVDKNCIGEEINGWVCYTEYLTCDGEIKQWVDGIGWQGGPIPTPCTVTFRDAWATAGDCTQ